MVMKLFKIVKFILKMVTHQNCTVVGGGDKTPLCSLGLFDIFYIVLKQFSCMIFGSLVEEKSENRLIFSFDCKFWKRNSFI